MIVMFNLGQLLIDHRMSIKELAAKLKVTRQLLDSIKHRGSANILTIRKIEAIVGDCTSYISQKQPKQKELFQSTGNGLENDWKTVGNQVEND